MQRALGLRPHVPDPRDLRLANYYDHTALAVPAGAFGHTDIFKPGEFGMLGNDSVGDCFPVGFAHAQMILGRLGGHDPKFDTAAVLRTYSAITGYTPGNPASDTGVEPREGAKHMQQVGMFDIAGHLHRVGHYVWLERGDVEQLTAALYEFEVVGVGYELPRSAQEQFDAKEPWAVVPGSPIEGGHWVPSSGRNADGNFEGLTWGEVEPVTPGFYERLCMCALVYLSHSDVNGEGKTPEGFDWERLRADIVALSPGTQP